MAANTNTATQSDLYTKIALDNKLVTKFQVRKAVEEQGTLEEQGEACDVGEAMVRLGFLSEGQHQSVLNACKYRGQRDFDKRFGRQCMRMDMLQQKTIEAALEVQKQEYGKSGEVRPLSEILLDQGELGAEEVDEVETGIRRRDMARSGKTGALAVSGPTPVLDKTKKKKKKRNKADDDEIDLEALEAEADDDDDLDDLDDEDLADLDDDDLDDEDLSDL
ncbi:hypothetical protein OAX78_03025, partial [Planctomycetota bacterium]|nr:hypothetical protein [Planctomycetota bacterium]